MQNRNLDIVGDAAADIKRLAHVRLPTLLLLFIGCHVGDAAADVKRLAHVRLLPVLKSTCWLSRWPGAPAHSAPP